jgi:hypothetical protein
MGRRTPPTTIPASHAPIAEAARRRDFFAARPLDRAPATAPATGPTASEIDRVARHLFGDDWETMPL